MSSNTSEEQMARTPKMQLLDPPPAVDADEALEQIAGSWERSPQKETPAAPTEVRKKLKEGRGLVARKGRETREGARLGKKTVRKSTIYFPPEVAQRLGVHCATVGSGLSDVVAHAVSDWLDRHAVS
jgi:hypothetical protein